MTEIEQLKSDLNKLTDIVTDLEGKVENLYARPPMPYSQGASSGWILTLGSDLRPYWAAP